MAIASAAACSLFADLDGFTSDDVPTTDAGSDGPSPNDDARVDGSIDDGRPLGPPAWRRVAQSGPAPRHSAAIAFDDVRKRIVLYGGEATPSVNAETWEWDGTTWTKRELPDNPLGRRGHRLVADEKKHVVFLYGGRRTDPSDQWEWDGVRWRNQPSTNHPFSLQAEGLAYDGSRGITVLFGGVHFWTDGGSAARDETWEWNGADWSLRSPSNHPSARRASGMVYDAIRKRVVLFGGGVGNVRNDTWEYDGNDWTEKEPIHFPSPRLAPCMAYHARRGISVMFGGAPNGFVPLGDTWQWDGTDWTQGPNGPPALRSCTMAYDPVHEAVVLFGGTLGNDGSAHVPSGETWVYE